MSSSIDCAAVLGRFEARARQAPDRTALVAGERTSSYGELDRRAGRRAGFLCGLGLGAESRVAACVEPSLEMVVAQLGVMKAQAAWVALDPTHARERLRFMLADSGARCVLTNRAAAPVVEGLGAPVVVLDAEWATIARAAPPPARPPVDPDTLAYVVYASGSTGTPKACALTHHGLADLVDFEQRSFGLGPHARATQLSGPAFDAAVWEVWSALASGACLEIVDGEPRMSAAALRDFLVARRVSHGTYVPTVLAQHLLALSWPEGGALRQLTFGGEALVMPASWSVPFRVFNAYGPAEATVCATIGEVPPGSVELPPVARRAAVAAPAGSDRASGRWLHARALGYVPSPCPTALRHWKNRVVLPSSGTKRWRRSRATAAGARCPNCSSR